MFLVLFSNHPSYIEPNIYILQYVILDWLTFQLTPVKKQTTFFVSFPLSIVLFCSFGILICQMPPGFWSSSHHLSDVTLSYTVSLVLKDS